MMAACITIAVTSGARIGTSAYLWAGPACGTLVVHELAAGNARCCRTYLPDQNLCDPAIYNVVV
jgi:hypothetical protein